MKPSKVFYVVVSKGVIKGKPEYPQLKTVEKSGGYELTL